MATNDRDPMCNSFIADFGHITCLYFVVELIYSYAYDRVII